MGIRIIDNPREGAAFYCSVTDTAFGPVFHDRYEAQEFLDWLPEDPRRFSNEELWDKLIEFREEKAEAEENEQAAMSE
jgi:hypothetical protein